MSGVYDLSKPDDRAVLEQTMISKGTPAEIRLKIARQLPDRQARIDYVRRVKEKHGAEAAQELIDGLKRVARNSQ